MWLEVHCWKEMTHTGPTSLPRDYSSQVTQAGAGFPKRSQVLEDPRHGRDTPDRLQPMEELKLGWRK